MSNLIKKITNFIASLGESMGFVSTMAHLWFGYSLVFTFAHFLPATKWWVLGVLAVAAGVKEFYFDAKYETNPPQTFWDNLQDFLGYVGGAVLSALIFK